MGEGEIPPPERTQHETYLVQDAGGCVVVSVQAYGVSSHQQELGKSIEENRKEEEMICTSTDLRKAVSVVMAKGDDKILLRTLNKVLGVSSTDKRMMYSAEVTIFADGKDTLETVVSRKSLTNALTGMHGEVEFYRAPNSDLRIMGATKGGLAQNHKIVEYKDVSMETMHQVLKDGKKLTVSPAEFLEISKFLETSVCTDETRPSLLSWGISKENGGDVKFASTDTYRLTVYSASDAGDDDFSAVIPVDGIRMLVKGIKAGYCGKSMVIRSDAENSSRVVSKVKDGVGMKLSIRAEYSYVNWRRVVPESPGQMFEVADLSRMVEMLEVCNRESLAADKDDPPSVVFEGVTGENVTIKSYEGEEVRDTGLESGSDFLVRIDARYLMDWYRVCVEAGIRVVDVSSKLTFTTVTSGIEHLAGPIVHHAVLGLNHVTQYIMPVLLHER